MKEHDLKTWPEEFSAVAEGTKRFEWREDDGRGFEVGDVLILHEWEIDPRSLPAVHPEGEYTGRVLRAHVTYLIRGPAFGVPIGYVVMSILPDPMGEPWTT